MSWLKATNDGVVLTLHIQPGAKKTETGKKKASKKPASKKSASVIDIGDAEQFGQRPQTGSITTFQTCDRIEIAQHDRGDVLFLGAHAEGYDPRARLVVAMRPTERLFCRDP